MVIEEEILLQTILDCVNLVAVLSFEDSDGNGNLFFAKIRVCSGNKNQHRQVEDR